MMTELGILAQQAVAFSLVLSVQLLLVLALRNPVRARFGAVACYRLWLLPVIWLPLYFLGPLLLATLATPAPVGGAPGSATPYQQALQQFVEIELLPFAFNDVGSTPLAASGDTNIQGWNVLAVLWAAGTVALMFWHGRRWLNFSREVRTFGLPLNATEKDYTGTSAHFADELPVLRMNAINSAALFGVFKPALLLPGTFTRRYDENQRHIILAHEAVHLRRGDNGLNLCALMLIALFWTNPLVYIAWRCFRLDQELSCDALALARCTREQRKRYARTLLDSLGSLPAYTSQPALSAWDDLRDIKERSLMVNQHMHLAKRPLATLLSLLSLAVLGASLTVAFADLVSPVVEAAEPAAPLPVIQQRVQQARQTVQESRQDIYESLQIVQESQANVQVAQQKVQDAQAAIQESVQDLQQAVQVTQASTQAVQQGQQEVQQARQAIEQQAPQESSPAVQQDAPAAAEEVQVDPAPLQLAQTFAKDSIPAESDSERMLDGRDRVRENDEGPAKDVDAQTANALSIAIARDTQRIMDEMPELLLAPAPAKVSQDPVPLARVHPDYPQRALRMGLEGWVKVRYSVDVTGSVVDVVVVASKPRKVFDEAAIAAVSHWQYDPKIEDGVPVQYAGAETTFRFQLADSR